MSKDYVAALDIGTTKVSVIVGRMAGDSVDIIGSGSAPSQGVRKGVIVDLDAAGAAIYEAIAMAEDNSSVELRTVYAGVGSSHIECVDSYGATGIKGKTVVERDIDRVIESASTIYVPLDKEVLHVLPKDYAIDGQEGILKPHGMSGVRLEANVRVITASQSALDNIINSAGKAGVKVVDMVFEGIASAKSVLSPEELEAGAAVVDIGGGTTDIAVYRDGGLVYASVLPVGGSQFTNDLSVGMKLPLKEAERVKVEHGYVSGNVHVNPEKSIEVTLMDGSVSKVRPESMRNILEPRSMELFDMIAREIKPHLLGTSGSCVVLTGGASRMRGLDIVAGAACGIPARPGRPVNGYSEVEKMMLQDPAYATGIGLLMYASQREARTGGYLLGALGEKIKGIARFFSSGRSKGYGQKKHVLAEPGT